MLWFNVKSKKWLSRPVARNLPFMLSSRILWFQMFCSSLESTLTWSLRGGYDRVQLQCLDVAVSLPNTIFWWDYPFPAEYYWLFWNKIIVNICTGLFLGSLFCSNDLFVSFYVHTDSFDDITLRYNLAPIRMFIIKMTRDNNCWWECGEKRTFFTHSWWECQLV